MTLSRRTRKEGRSGSVSVVLGSSSQPSTRLANRQIVLALEQIETPICRSWREFLVSADGPCVHKPQKPHQRAMRALSVPRPKASNTARDGHLPIRRNVFADHQAVAAGTGIARHLPDTFNQVFPRQAVPAQRRVEPEELVGPGGEPGSPPDVSLARRRGPGRHDASFPRHGRRRDSAQEGPRRHRRGPVRPQLPLVLSAPRFHGRGGERPAARTAQAADGDLIRLAPRAGPAHSRPPLRRPGISELLGGAWLGPREEHAVNDLRSRCGC